MVFGGPGIHQVHRPPLELVRADFFQGLGAREVCRRDDAVKRIGDLEVEAVTRLGRLTQGCDVARGNFAGCED